MDIESTIVLLTFVAVYVGMAAGRWPWLAVDRTGIALCGAIVVLFLDPAPARTLQRIDFGALAILFGLMVLSAQFAAAGFYDWCAARLAASTLTPGRMLALLISITGGLSSILANDVVVYAMTPILCDGLRRTGRDPRPFLFGLVGAANVGSAATLVGNPQNILLGEHGALDFWAYLFFAAPLSVAGLVIVHFCIAVTWRRQLSATPPAQPVATALPPADRAAIAKGIVATALLLALYMTDLPRWQTTMLVAGMLLISRRHSSREIIASVDWHLLLLLGSLFVVTSALDIGQAGGLPHIPPAGGVASILEAPALAGLAALIGSNTVGNVPFVVLVLSAAPGLSQSALYALAVLSTFAGNLLIVGSLANLIVAERARGRGVAFRFLDHLRAGVPMTLLTMALALVWLETT